MGKLLRKTSVVGLMEARGGKVAPDELRKQISFMGRGPGLGRAGRAMP